MSYIYADTFGDIPRMPEPGMMPNDVKRILNVREHTFNKRLYFISESNKMIYRYNIPEEYHPKPYERSWDKIHPGCKNGYVDEVYHRTTNKSITFTLIPDSDSKKRISYTLH